MLNPRNSFSINLLVANYGYISFGIKSFNLTLKSLNTYTSRFPTVEIWVYKLIALHSIVYGNFGTRPAPPRICFNSWCSSVISDAGTVILRVNSEFHNYSIINNIIGNIYA